MSVKKFKNCRSCGFEIENKMEQGVYCLDCQDIWSARKFIKLNKKFIVGQVGYEPTR